MSAGPVHVCLYGEIDMNLVDGSSIWLQSVAQTLAHVPGVEVTMLLRSPLRRELIVEPLRTYPNIRILDPATPGSSSRLDPAGAERLLTELDEQRRIDVLLLRGAGVADAVAAGGRFDGRVWLYHVPVDGGTRSAEAEDLRRRSESAHRVLCQTEAIAERVSAALPGIEGRILLLPPMIPDMLADAEAPERPLRRLLYAGKFAPAYYFLEMVALFSQLRDQIPGLEWEVAGDKIHNPPEVPGFKPAAEAALRTTPGLRWHGAVSRAHVHDLLTRADLALSLRHPDMDSSAELSTKVLEYGAAGCPVLLNRNRVHTALLGSDYPLLAGDLEEARLRVMAAAVDPELRAAARRRCLEAASQHTFARVAETLAPHLPAAPAHARATTLDAGGSPRLLLAGHQFNFLDQIREYAVSRRAAVREDRWTRHVVHDERATAAALEWAEVIHCEWCLGAAIWYSHHRRPDQRLVVRFHRMELETAYPAEVDVDRVEAMVFVARHVMEAACEQYGWPPDHPAFRVIPNAIDCGRLALEKLPGSQYTLGLTGWVPMLKRIDRALDIVERLRARDERFRLIVKGNAPWDYYWMAARESERRYYEAALARVERSPLLRSAVSFEPFGRDIAPFLQKIGWMLSVSNIEGHAVALAEGMAAGTIPVVIDRPGANDQYPARWIHADPQAAAERILEVSANGSFEADRALAGELATELDWKRLAPVWGELLGLEAQ